MFSAKFYIDTKKNNTLMLRIINNCRKAEMSLGLSMTAKELEETTSGDTPNLRASKLIAEWTATIKAYMLELAERKEQNKDAKEIRDVLRERLLGSKPQENVKKPSKGNFTVYFQKFIDDKDNKGTKGVYQHTLNRIRLFDPEIDTKTFKDVDLEWLTRFEAFCAKTASKNARNIHLRNIRAVFNSAIDYEITDAYPFRRFKIRPEQTRKRSLTVEELRELFEHPVEPYAELYRDMFKLIFMLIGINSADLHSLKSVTNDGRVDYRRAKTHKLYSIKVEPEAMEVIERYKGVKGLLCIADRWSDSRNFRHQCNNALQLIGANRNKGGRRPGGEPKKTDKNNKTQGKWPGLTTYWARHSWATIAASLDIPRDTIAHALGHGGNTVTDIYIDFDQKKVDEANRKVLDWVLYGKK